MKTKWVLTQEAFDRLLAWLDSDRENAGIRFLEISGKLTLFFARRGCPVAEELTDETMNRVSRRVEDIAPTYVGDQALYFHGVSQNVYWEWLEKEKRLKELRKRFDLRLLFSYKPAVDETIYECLDECLQKLDAKSREELLVYYRFNGRLKIETRKKMADDIGITPGALTTRVYRLRAELEPCITECSKTREDQRVL
ncbi:MAG: hypothetical protein AABN34_12575 [Acidobacteriota bacterium]